MDKCAYCGGTPVFNITTGPGRNRVYAQCINEVECGSTLFRSYRNTKRASVAWNKHNKYIKEVHGR